MIYLKKNNKNNINIFNITNDKKGIFDLKIQIIKISQILIHCKIIKIIIKMKAIIILAFLEIIQAIFSIIILVLNLKIYLQIYSQINNSQNNQNTQNSILSNFH